MIAKTASIILGGTQKDMNRLSFGFGRRGKPKKPSKNDDF
jgi:hypothetical protein